MNDFVMKDLTWLKLDMREQLTLFKEFTQYFQLRVEPIKILVLGAGMVSVLIKNSDAEILLDWLEEKKYIVGERTS